MHRIVFVVCMLIVCGTVYGAQMNNDEITAEDATEPYDFSKIPQAIRDANNNYLLSYHLFDAARNDNSDVIRYLIEQKKVNPDVRAKYFYIGHNTSYTPLHTACAARHFLAVKALLDSNADMYLLDDNYNAPFNLLYKYHLNKQDGLSEVLPITELFLAKKIDLSQIPDLLNQVIHFTGHLINRDLTSLNESHTQKALVLIKLLLENGLSSLVNYKPFGQPLYPLEAIAYLPGGACYNDIFLKPALAKLLLKHGALTLSGAQYFLNLAEGTYITTRRNFANIPYVKTALQQIKEEEEDNRLRLAHAYATLKKRRLPIEVVLRITDYLPDGALLKSTLLQQPALTPAARILIKEMHRTATKNSYQHLYDALAWRGISSNEAYELLIALSSEEQKQVYDDQWNEFSAQSIRAQMINKFNNKNHSVDCQ